jgi:hypothetical protein
LACISCRNQSNLLTTIPMNQLVSDGLLSSHSLITSKLQFNFGKFLFRACSGTEMALVAQKRKFMLMG